MACLVVVEGPAAGAHFALGSHKLVDIGRDEECTFQIVDPQVSRHHLQIRADEEARHVATDCRSVNGVLINGFRIAIDTLLKNGDEIKIGATGIIYSTDDYPDAQTAMTGVRSGRQWKRTTMKCDP